MNKLFKHLTASLLGLSMAVGVGVAVANVGKKAAEVDAVITSPYTHNFANGDITVEAQASKSLSGINWAISSAEYVGFDATKGTQLGSGSNPQKEDWTMSTAISNFGEGAKIKKITMGLSTASKGGISWNFAAGTSSGGDSVDAMTTVTNKSVTFATPVSSGNIVITLNSNTKAKAIYIKNITVEFVTSSKTASAISVFDKDDQAISDSQVIAVSESSTYTIKGIVSYSTGESDDHDYSVTSENVGISFGDIQSDGTCSVSFTKNGTFLVEAKSNATTSVKLSFSFKVTYFAEQIFAKYTGVLTDGDYLVLTESTAMSNSVVSYRLTYESMIVSNDAVTTNNTDAIWHISKNGEYWNICNNVNGKYAASTGAKNKAQLLDDKDDDKSLWSVDATSTSTSYNFINKQNDVDGVNAYLRYNSGYGYACYASGTGSSLTLYKLVDGSKNLLTWGMNFSNAFKGGENPICKGVGQTDTVQLKTAWDAQALAFGDLTEESKAFAKTATAQEGGNYIEDALALYDWCVGHYDASICSRFITDRSVSSFHNTNFVLSDVGSETTITIIVIVSLLSVTTLGAYLLIKKIKHE